MSLKSRFIAAIVLALALTALVFFYFGLGTSYHGDGEYTDRGILSYYPRFRIRFTPIDLAEPGEHRFSFTGAPRERLTLELLVPMKEFPVPPSVIGGPAPTSPVESVAGLSYDYCNSLRGLLEARLNANGVTVADTRTTHEEWTLSWGGSGGYWHDSLRFFHFSPYVQYTLTVVVKKSPTPIQRLILIPELSGGGYELP